jgi:hypothetical protein
LKASLAPYLCWWPRRVRITLSLRPRPVRAPSSGSQRSPTVNSGQSPWLLTCASAAWRPARQCFPSSRVVPPLGPRWVRAATVEQGQQRSPLVTDGLEKPQVAGPPAQAAAMMQAGDSDCGPEGRGLECPRVGRLAKASSRASAQAPRPWNAPGVPMLPPLGSRSGESPHNAVAPTARRRRRALPARPSTARTRD